MCWSWVIGSLNANNRMAAFSIITATLNSALTIADCLLSVNSQTEPVEHIIIDGLSKDNTLEIVRNVSPSARILSEPDKGLYDAMNKGIELASGDVIGILNADDFYSNPNVIKKAAEIFEDNTVASCYGDLVYVDTVKTDHVIRYWQSGNFDCQRFYYGWMPPHPTFFARRSIYEKYGRFNLSLGSSADYELMLRFLFKHRISTAYIPEVLVNMRAGGVSNASLKNRILANKMDRLAWKVNGLKPMPWTLLLKPLSKIYQYLVRY